MATMAIAKRKAAVKKYRKRNPGGGNFVPLLVIGGAVVAGWWYVNNYGPKGAVKNAAGQKINPSWWEQWFGASTATVAPVQPGAPGGTNTTTTTNTGTGAGAGTGTSTAPNSLTAAAQSFIANAGTLTVNNYNALSQSDRAAVVAYFNAHPEQVPNSFADNSFTAYGLGLGGKTSAVINGKQYILTNGVWRIGSAPTALSDPPPPGAGTPRTFQGIYDAVYRTAIANGQDPNGLNIDQWGYYYQQVVGPIDPTSGDAMINAAVSQGSITQRSQPIQLGTFVQLLKDYGNVGLSGVGDLVPVSRWGSAATPVGTGIYSRNRGRRDVN